MGITLANFQLKAIEALMEAMGEPNRDIILKSCTGSGKTSCLFQPIAALSQINWACSAFILLQMRGQHHSNH